MAPRKNKHIGSSFDDYLKEEGDFEKFEAAAIKRAVAFKIAHQMKAKNVTATALAVRMKTSRSQIDRLLNPNDGNVTLKTLEKAALALRQPARSPAHKTRRATPRKSAVKKSVGLRTVAKKR